MNELAIFAGAGGGILGGQILGHSCVCAVEIDPYAQAILVARQNDGIFPPFPIWDDVRTFNGNPWRGIVDVVSGGFPCQDISVAGRGAGITGEKSGLWMEMARIVCEVQPRYVFVENSPMLASRGLDRVLWDLAGMGFDARWGVLGARHAGLDHERDRIWIVAHSSCNGWKGKSTPRDGSSARSVIEARCSIAGGIDEARLTAWRRSQPGVQRVADGMAFAMDRHRTIGNGQVPRVAAAAWDILNNS